MPYKNPEDTKKYRKAYYWKNKEKANECNRQWYISHPEYNKQYRETHVEELRKLRRKWYINNLKKCTEKNKQWIKEHPKRMKELQIKYQSKRARGLGFEPLNNYFEGSEAHHLDDTYVVYIPKEIHQSIYHCLETGQNMVEINSYAMNYILLERSIK